MSRRHRRTALWPWLALVGGVVFALAIVGACEGFQTLVERLAPSEP